MADIRKAERKKAKLRLAFIAPSGAGKTLSSLLLAYGLVDDWGKIGMIDTEAGSGELYTGETFLTQDGSVTIGDYLYCRIEPDFTIPKYLDAIRSMQSALGEGGVIIIDSLSHAWSGSGGLLDKQGKIADKSGNSYSAWRTITPEHNNLVETILQSNCHIIADIRAKQDYVQEKTDSGKSIVKKIGMGAVQREGLEYEFTVVFDIDMQHYATTSKDRTNLFDGLFIKISPSTGIKLREWLEKGIEVKEPTFEDYVESIMTSETLDILKSKFAIAKDKYKNNADALAKIIDAKDLRKAQLLPPPKKEDKPAEKDSKDKNLDAALNGQTLFERLKAELLACKTQEEINNFFASNDAELKGLPQSEYDSIQEIFVNLDTKIRN